MAVMRPSRLATVLLESTLLALTFLGLGGTAAIYWHAALGAPLALLTKMDNPAGPSGQLAPPPDVRLETASAVAAFSLLPDHVFLTAPFTPQAPFGDWAQPYQDACEEASVVMAMAWVRRQTTITPAEADRAILALVDYERYHFGYHRDTGVGQSAKLLTHHLGYPNVRKHSDITLADIKSELASGNIVLLPVLGTMLPNPYYFNQPDYHMVVVVGYDDIAQEFIVHDPGTRRGANFRYKYSTLFAAIHDWTGSPETVTLGPKAALIVASPER